MNVRYIVSQYRISSGHEFLSGKIGGYGAFALWDEFMLNKWYNVILVYNGIAVYVYLDNEKIDEEPFSDLIPNSDDPLLFAKYHSEIMSNVSIDEILILSEAVDESVIQYLYER